MSEATRRMVGDHKLKSVIQVISRKLIFEMAHEGQEYYVKRAKQGYSRHRG